MGQLEKYGLYVLCLVIFLILGVAIWGGEPEAATPQGTVPLQGAPATGDAGAGPSSGLQGAAPARFASGADVVQALLQPQRLPPPRGRNLPPPDDEDRGQETAPAPEPQPQAPADRRTYRVQKGDILGKIAQRELGSARHWQAILALNPGVDPAHLKPGQELLLPSPAELEGAGQASSGSDTGWRWHTVQDGENFWTISKKLFGTVAMTDEIQALNPKIDPRRLRAGMEIKVPRSR